MKMILVIIVLLLHLGCSTQYTTITKTAPGFHFGNVNGKLRIEFIYDPMCDDTRDFDNNVFLPLLSSLDSATLEKIHFSIVPFPLPYHITAHKVVQGLLYVQDQKGDQAALESLRYFLNNINLWDEQTVKTLTINQYMANLAENLSNKYGFDKATIFAQLMHYSEYDKNTRVVAKYAMGALRIPGTPSAYINGVAVDGGTQMNKDQWITLIKSLL